MAKENAHDFTSPPDGRPADDRLGSWKEIAAYLKSGVRSVQRWEGLEGLPVHRHVHAKRGSVYAFKSELDAWLDQRQARLAGQALPTPREEIRVQEPAVPGGGPQTAEPKAEPPDKGLASSLPHQTPRTRGLRRLAVAGLALALVAVLVLAAIGFRQALLPQAKAQAGRVMLAVLPFVNLSGDAGEDYFSDGLTEEMITELGRMDPARLGVIARTSSMKYKHTNEDVAQIGRELGVNYLVEGSVRRSGSQARISVQLIQVSDRTHLWAQSYERHVGDPLAVQEDVARAIVEKIRIKVAPPGRARLTNPQPVNSEAYEDYLKGRYFWNRRDHEGLLKGIDFFSRAVEREPDYALAYSGLADCYTLFGLEGPPSREVMSKAKAAALKSVELDDRLAEAHTSLAGVKAFYDWDWAGAESGFQRALELNANYAPAHHWYANLCLLPQGRFEEAIAEMKRAQELDPLSLIINTDLGWTYELARQDNKALDQYQRTMKMDPDFAPLHFRLQKFYAERGMYSEAVAERSKEMALAGLLAGAAEIERQFAAGGYRKVLEAELQQSQAQSKRTHSLSAATAATYARLGEKDKALEALEDAYQDGDPGLIYLNVDPAFASLRSEPRFERLVRIIGLSH